MVTYNLLQSVGDQAYVGPFQGIARLTLKMGEVIDAHFSATTRSDYELLSEALRTLRFQAR